MHKKMKKALIIFFTLFFSINTYGQEKSLPNVEVKTLKGKTFNIKNLDNDGSPMVMSFGLLGASLVKRN